MKILLTFAATFFTLSSIGQTIFLVSHNTELDKKVESSLRFENLFSSKDSANYIMEIFTQYGNGARPYKMYYTLYDKTNNKKYKSTIWKAGSTIENINQNYFTKTIVNDVKKQFITR